jgi:thiamine pyrophosphate-dependent acetolactate synthase large subunit-like protein
MIEAKKVFEAFQNVRGEAIVSVQGTSGKHWVEISTNPRRDISTAEAMGHSTPAMFGIALGLPEQKVVHFDTEGALLMNLGVLTSIAGKNPKNFIHFLLDNGCYATTGGQPVPNSENIDYAMIAKGAGYPATYSFNDLEDLSLHLNEIMEKEGPVFVSIKVLPEVENLPIGQREKRKGGRSRSQMIKDFREELGIS